jgi:small subunit ribosomal protein S8
MQDPIGDMLTRLRNAQMAGKQHAIMSASKQKSAVAELLKAEGYIRDFSVDVVDGQKQMVIELKYIEGKPVIDEVKRVSRPGLRVYRSKDKLPKIKGGLGIAIVSTSRGLMTDRTARAQGIGGEFVCYVA